MSKLKNIASSKSAKKIASVSDLLPRLMIVEDDPGIQNQLKWALADYELSFAQNRTEALSLLDSFEPHVIILDLGLPPDANGASEGLLALEQFKEKIPLVKIIVSTGNDDRSNALKAIGSGAYDFCSKPIDIDVFNHIIQRAWHIYQIEEENLAQKSQLLAEQQTRDIVTSNNVMLSICDMIVKIAPVDISVLVTGESGTGKEVVARSIYNNSNRNTGPFIAINCAAIPETLLESELFGHEKGAFTGAIKQTIGKIEQANKGVLFLDEIGDLPFSLQAKLLRFLQDRQVDRLGGRQPVPVDIRLICATNKPLEKMIAEGSFREDLYYRLNEIHIDLPPLRDRKEDIPILAQLFVSRYAKQFDRPEPHITENALQAMMSYNWPGNIRELESKLKKAVILATEGKIKPKDMDLATFSSDTFISIREARQKADTEVILRALHLCKGNLTLAAEKLDVSRPKLYSLIEEHQIDIPKE